MTKYNSKESLQFSQLSLYLSLYNSKESLQFSQLCLYFELWLLQKPVLNKFHISFRKLCEFFKLNESSTDLREAAILDYYTSAVWWAKEQGFTEQQMSGFFTAIHTLLDNIKGGSSFLSAQFCVFGLHFCLSMLALT